MSLEVHPVGLRCGARNGGLSCVYCYERPLGKQNESPSLDLAAVKRQIEAAAKTGESSFSLFGGEALLAPLDDLEALWRYGLERFGKNGVQTAGSTIREEHYELFRKYKVNVAFSIDGPGELNDSRVAGTREQTRAATDRANAALERCLAEKVCQAVIVTLNRHNAAEDRLPALADWLRRIVSLGVTSINFHDLEVDGPGRLVALTEDENVRAFLFLWDLWTRELRLRAEHVQPFRDIIAVLRGQDVWKWNDGTDGGVGCTWTACDPTTTPAVYGVEPDGSRSLCSRVHKTRTAWTPAPPGPLFRQLALRELPQEEGGCKGCRQMITCKGQCPGTAIGGDWRLRSASCGLWKALLEEGERRLVAVGEVPITLRPDRDKIEEALAEWWRPGRPARLATVLRGERPGTTLHGDYADHGDHEDARKAIPHIVGAEEVK